MYADHNQTVPSWVSVSSKAGEEMRDEVKSMMRERTRGVINEKKNGKSERLR